MEPQNQGFDETKTSGAPEDNMKDSKDYTNRDFSNTMHLCREDDVPLFNRVFSGFPWRATKTSESWRVYIAGELASLSFT